MFGLSHGIPWVHIFPALLAVVFGFLYLKTKLIYLKVVWGILWLLLLPNTAYIFTDMERISLHWNSISTVMRIASILQYVCLEIIGIVSYLLAMLPFKDMISAWRFSKRTQIAAIILLNFFIGFGMVLGRTGYTNSYVLFTQPSKVYFAAIKIITSLNLLGLTLAFSILCNCIYFTFRNTSICYTKKLLY